MKNTVYCWALARAHRAHGDRNELHLRCRSPPSSVKEVGGNAAGCSEHPGAAKHDPDRLACPGRYLLDRPGLLTGDSAEHDDHEGLTVTRRVPALHPHHPAEQPEPLRQHRALRRPGGLDEVRQLGVGCVEDAGR